MKESELLEIEAREAEATKGPWAWESQTGSARLDATGISDPSRLPSNHPLKERTPGEPVGILTHEKWDGQNIVEDFEVFNFCTMTTEETLEGWVMIPKLEEPGMTEIGLICRNEADLHFIAHSRTDIPKLTAEIRRLQSILKAHNLPFEES